MMPVLIPVAKRNQQWWVSLMGTALHALAAVGLGCLAAFVAGYLGYPGQQPLAFGIGVFVAMVSRWRGLDAAMGTFGWLTLFAGAYLLLRPEGASFGGGILVFLGCWLLVAHVT